MTTLRPYQVTSVQNVFTDWAAGYQRLALVLPTGAGKTVVFSEIIRHFLSQTEHRVRVLVLAHRDELLGQAAAKIASTAPDLRVGLMKGSVKQIGADVIVASQQTLSRAANRRLLPQIGLVIVDEAHRTMTPTYLTLLDELGCMVPGGPKVLGVTATFTREDSKRLTDFYEKCSYALDVLDLIPEYLVPPRFRRVLIAGLDLSGVPIGRAEGGKDLAVGALDEAMERAGAPGVVAEAYRIHAAGRSGIVFCPTVSSAEHVAAALRQIGITSESVAGKTSMQVRRDIIERYKRGQIQTITNCAVFTEGFDAPVTSCVVIARPTMSKILFRQMVGRGLRLHPGKTDCLVLDVVGATGRNDLKTLNDITEANVHVEEDETLDHAASRVLPRVSAPRDEFEGNAQVSGSLAAIDVDPWALEWARGRPKKAFTEEPMTDEEIAEERARREEERRQAALEKERAKRRRYKDIPMRSGWFMRTTNPKNWFINIETNAGQNGFVCVITQDDESAIVGLHLPGVKRRLLGIYPDHATAAQVALNFLLSVVDTAMARYKVDPEATWRRKPANERQMELAERVVRGVDFDEYHYSGQVGDFITWGTNHRNVDKFAEVLTAEVTSSGRLLPV